METDWEARYEAHDMPWEKGEPSPGLVDFRAAAGFSVTGCDIAPSAIRLAQEKTAAAGLSAQFILGDFLADAAPGSYDWIFEHTLFCAIDPARRDDYVNAVVRRLKAGGHYLAVNYLIPDTDGPPFGTKREELVARFSPRFDLQAEWVPRSYPNRTGLELMLWWRRNMVT